MHNNIYTRIVSGIAAAVMTLTNIAPLSPMVAEEYYYGESAEKATLAETVGEPASEAATEKISETVEETIEETTEFCGPVQQPTEEEPVWQEDDLSHQSIELYPNGEEAEQMVSLEGMMPEGATAEAVDVSEDYDGIVAYDISISTGEDDYQPGEKHPILVEIVDPSIPRSDTLQLWHIHDDGSRERVYNFDVVEGKLSFYATGFSVYEIVNDAAEANIICNVVPVSGDTSAFDTFTVVTAEAEESFTYPVVEKIYPPISGTTTQITSLESFESNIASGIYLKTNRTGYYATNCQDNNVRNTNRTGIKAITGKLDMPSAYNAGAAKYYFEAVDSANHKYKIYTYADDNTTKKYIGHQSGNSIYLTNDTNNTAGYTDETVWVVSYEDGNGFKIKDSTSNFYITEAKANPGTVDGLAAYDKPTDDGLPFSFYLYSPPDLSSDPYGLDGNTYGLVCFKDAANGNALQAGYYNNTVTQLGNTPVKRVTDPVTDAVSYTSQYGISGWTFEWVSGTTYKLKAIAQNGGAKKYLQITATGLALVDASEASVVMVTPDTNNRIKISNANGAIKVNGSINFIKDTSGSYFDLVDISAIPADTLGLHGQTYALINKRNAVIGNAVMAETDPANANQLDNQNT